MDINRTTGVIIEAAIQVHRTLGPGLFESVYESALSHELTKRAIPHTRRLPIPVIYDGVTIQHAFEADLLVEDTVIVELKAVEGLNAHHRAQVLTYIRLAGKPIGQLINFNEILLKNGIHRIVNQLPKASDLLRVPRETPAPSA
jgi:GxxExxY protein